MHQSIFNIFGLLLLSLFAVRKPVFANSNEKVDLDFKSFGEGLCQSNPCCNSGICSGEGNNFYCDCQPGWTGDTCNTESKQRIFLT